jgi:hypothetical protein
MFAQNVKLDMSKTLKVPQEEGLKDEKPELFFEVLCA